MTVTLMHKSRCGIPIVTVVRLSERTDKKGRVYRYALVEYYDGERRWVPADTDIMQMVGPSDGHV